MIKVLQWFLWKYILNVLVLCCKEEILLLLSFVFFDKCASVKYE